MNNVLSQETDPCFTRRFKVVGSVIDRLAGSRMIRTPLSLGSLIAVVMLLVGQVSGDEAINIGSRRELFVDRFLIDPACRVPLHMHEPHDEGPVVKFDKLWEGPHAGYVTILKDAERYRMYYRGISKYGPDGSEHERTCVAESSDGLQWTKPELGLFEFDGNKANNIVLANAAPVTHNFCPMIDSRQGVPADQRFKAVGGTGKALFAYVSADGLNWRKLRDEPILDKEQMTFPFSHLFDSQNLVFWSEHENAYLCYFRVWDGIRRIARSTSSDFLTWTPAIMMEQPHDDGSGSRPAPAEHLYTNQTSPYFRAPHLYLAIAARFFEGRQVLTAEQAKTINVNPDYFRDTSDAVLMSSRGGNIYDRTFLEGYLRPGIGPQNWVSRTNYPALNLVQTSPTEMSLYVNQDYAQPTAHVRRYSLRLDGLASVRAGVNEVELFTKPLTYTGQTLKINFSTSAGGGIRFVLRDLESQSETAASSATSQEQIGNEIERTVTWKNDPVKTLSGRRVQMRIFLKDADLYSFQFVP
jgi:hypothetical protein